VDLSAFCLYHTGPSGLEFGETFWLSKAAESNGKGLMRVAVRDFY
jgi:hypothetical protein